MVLILFPSNGATTYSRIWGNCTASQTRSGLHSNWVDIKVRIVSPYSIFPNQPRRCIHFAASNTGMIVNANPVIINQSSKGR